MGETLALGRRVELVSMDGHCRDISLALYRADEGGTPVYRVHTYSRHEDAVDRPAGVAAVMVALGDVEADGALVRFACGEAHERACRRLFLEACKVDPSGGVEPRPLTIFDRKSDGDLVLVSEGAGVYRLRGPSDDERLTRRREAVAAGLVKLGDLTWRDDDSGRFAFPCAQSHDRLLGLLLVRALNVRGAERERQLAAARGQLLAPSAQTQT